jgi:hypothetical protein
MTEQTDAAEVEALRADLANAECACGHQAEWHSALLGCNAEDWDQPACDCRGDWLDAVLPLIAAREAAARTEALTLVRQVEADMAQQALEAWRSADARRGLSDHAGLVVHADALTRWSERFRMAFDGEDYRIARTDGAGS